MTEDSLVNVPKIQTAKYWGFFMASEANAKAFTNALILASSMHPEGIRYLEIGLGNCGTINAVDWTLSQLPGNHRMVGVEHVSWTMAFLVPYLAELIIRDEHQVPEGEWDVVFIDACHCKQCVMNDFNSIRDRLSERAFVLFHDTNPEAQGMHANMSEHQHQGIEVLAALDQCDFSGFDLIAETPGGPTFNGLRVYQKKDSGMSSGSSVLAGINPTDSGIHGVASCVDQVVSQCGRFAGELA